MADDLGFWFAIFQPDPSRDRVKVWLDGSEDYQFFKVTEFIQLGASTNIIPSLREACRDYSFFLWKVKDNSISRVNFKGGVDSLRKDLLDSIAAANVSEEASIAEKYSRVEIDLTEGKNPKIKI